MTSTFRQRLVIASLVGQSGARAMQEIYEATPKNNDKHIDTRVDYTEYILADKLEPLSYHEADFVIKVLLGRDDKFGRKSDKQKAFNYLVNLKLI